MFDSSLMLTFDLWSPNCNQFSGQSGQLGLNLEKAPKGIPEISHLRGCYKQTDNPNTFTLRAWAIADTVALQAHTLCIVESVQQGCHTGSQWKEMRTCSFRAHGKDSASERGSFLLRTVKAAQRQDRWCHSAQRTTDFSQPTELLTLYWLLTELNHFISVVGQSITRRLCVSVYVCVWSVFKCCMGMCALWPGKHACTCLWFESIIQRYKL